MDHRSIVRSHRSAFITKLYRNRGAVEAEGPPAVNMVPRPCSESDLAAIRFARTMPIRRLKPSEVTIDHHPADIGMAATKQSDDGDPEDFDEFKRKMMVEPCLQILLRAARLSLESR